MTQTELFDRITINPTIFGGKPIIRGRRLAIEHVLGMLARATQLRRFWRHAPGWNMKMFKPVSFICNALSAMSMCSQ